MISTQHYTNISIYTAKLKDNKLAQILKQYFLSFQTDALYEDDVTEPIGFPTILSRSGVPQTVENRLGNIPQPANKISRELFEVEQQSRRTSDLTVLFMTFGQFLDHDIALSPHASCSNTE